MVTVIVTVGMVVRMIFVGIQDFIGGKTSSTAGGGGGGGSSTGSCRCGCWCNFWSGGIGTEVRLTFGSAAGVSWEWGDDSSV